MKEEYERYRYQIRRKSLQYGQYVEFELSTFGYVPDACVIYDPDEIADCKKE